MDYTDDSIYKASRIVSQMALRNIRAPVTPNGTTNVQTSDKDAASTGVSSGTSSSVLTMKNPNVSVDVNANVGKAYEDFMKTANALSNELDQFLTDLDNQYQEVEYPDIDVKKKGKHNKEFEKYYKGGDFDRDELYEYSFEQLAEACKETGVIPYIHRSWDLDKLISKILERSDEQQFQIYRYLNGNFDAQESDTYTENSSPDEEAHSVVDEEGSVQYKGDDTESDTVSYAASYDYPSDFEGDNPNGDGDGRDDGDGDGDADGDGDGDGYSDENEGGDSDGDGSESYYSSENAGSEDGESDSDSDSDNGESSAAVVPLPAAAAATQTQEPDMSLLSTSELKVVANQITNMQVMFSNSLKPHFKQLSQSKVNTLSDVFDELKPQINELLSDEFIVKFHAPQVATIKKAFDKLYTDVYVSTRSYVKKTTDGGFLDHRHYNDFAERYYL